MHRQLATAALLLFALPALAQNAGPVSQKRLITAKDLFDFRWIGDMDLAPAGKQVVFVETSVTPAHDGYQTELYLLDAGAPGAQPVRLTLHEEHDSAPRWSPDGRQIAFLRSVDRDGHAAPPQLYVMAATPGASPVKISDLPKGAANPQWTPDGHALLVTSNTPGDQAKAKAEAARVARSTGDAAHVSDVRLIDRATYRFNGEGYLNPDLVPQLYLISLPAPDGTQQPARQLTEGRYGVGDAVVNAAKGWVFYTTVHEDEPIYDREPHNSLYGFALPSPDMHTPEKPAKDMPATGFTADLTLRAGGLALSPDGNHFAFHAEQAPAGAKEGASHQQSDLWTLALSWNGNVPALVSAPRNLTGKLRYEMGSGVGGDNVAPRGGARSNITWAADSTHLLDIAGFRGSVLLLSVDTANDAVTELTQPKESVLGFVSDRAQTETVALLSNPILIGDLFSLGAGKSQTQLTDINGALFSQLNVQMPLDLQVKPTHHAGDLHGETIDTFIELPPGSGSRPAQPLPTILNIHGGPHAAYGWVFDQEMLLMAADGYAVIYPNPRGSTTYGNNFANIIMNNYPGDDFHDLMDTADEAVKLGIADPNKLGVTGGSGGGLLTDWTVTQTNRFKAAVAQRDIVDWANWWYTADISGFHQSFYPASPPFDHVELYKAHSPLTYVNNIMTPMMFILGDADYRTPPTAGGEVFFRALKYKCIPTVMVRFPRESHELSRSGEPWHRVERLQNIIDWFDLYLNGKPEPQYNTTAVAACKTTRP